MVYIPYSKLRTNAMLLAILAGFGSLHAAAHEKQGIQAAIKRNASTLATIGGLSVLGSYAYADYADRLPLCLPSIKPAIAGIKNFCTDHPEKALLFGCGAVAGISSLVALASWYQIYTHNSYTNTHKRYTMVPLIKTMDQSTLFSPDERQEADTFFAHYAHVSRSLPEVPASIQKRCINYVGLLPQSLNDSVQKTIRNMDIHEPVFVYETNTTTHAESLIFNKIGLHSLVVSWGATKPFWHIVRHEACHLKFKHRETTLGDQIRLLEAHKKGYWQELNNGPGSHVVSVFQKSCPEKDPSACISCKKLAALRSLPEGSVRMYHLYQELEAELGGLFYGKRDDNIDITTIEYGTNDGDHPSNEDQIRYNHILAERLAINPLADYTIVQDLAKEYLFEKQPLFRSIFADEQIAHAASSSE